MFSNNKALLFATYTLLYLISLTLANTIEENVLPAQPKLTDSNHYIVVFKPDVPSVNIKNQIQKLNLHQKKSNTNGTNDTSLSKNSTEKPTLNITDSIRFNTIGKFRWYSARFQSKEVEELLSANETTDESVVQYWIKDASFSLQEFVQTNPPSWGLDRIDQRSGTDGNYKFPTVSGDGVTIYLMDSGINENHSDIAGRVTIGKTVVGDPNDHTDANGHGTFVAGVCCGTKYGVAKKAEIVSVKTLDSEGNGRLSDVLVGLQWIVEQHKSKPGAKSIVNLSLGALYSQATNDAIEQALGLGIHFSVAAGNYGEDACLYSPGSTPGAITVGAIDQDDSVAYYSNFGQCVDIFAPGTNIKSIWPTSSTATRTLSGTSMAAPHVAGTMALFLSDRNFTPPQLANYMKRVSSLITENFTINNTGVFYNENKTVIDNAIDMGYKVKGRMNEKTRVNILYNYPTDGKENWIYGQSLSQASSLIYTLTLPLYALIFIITIIFL
ncbi:peptidase S8/S53 domain-containing protein [Thamnidium elegans]|nr:peptidase S8/S53 domain-containing protein [Thamnidium elegans]